MMQRTESRIKLLVAMACALLMGLIGGILPAVRAARLPIVNALREL